MAGGLGTRLGMGEKPMVTLLGRPLLEYVVRALLDSVIDKIFVATTSNVPGTSAWAKDRGLRVIETQGLGYVTDMISAVLALGIEKPLLFVMADLPLLTGQLINEILDVYENRPEPALSVHTPLSIHRMLGRKPPSLFNYEGQLIVPAGVNILDGAIIQFEQEDYHLILDRVELAVNVNAPEDLVLCETLVKDSLKVMR